MRVLTIAQGEVFGGAERQILALCKEFKNRGIACAAAIFYRGTLAEQLLAAGIETLVLDNASLAKCSRQIRKMKTMFAPTVVHLHGYRAAFSWLVARQDRLTPSVFTHHGAREWSMRQLWISLKLVVYEQLEFLACRMLKSRNVFVTQDLMNRKLGAEKRTHCSVIYNGIDPISTLAHVDPSPYENSGTFRFVSVGRLEAVKSLDIALEALKAVQLARNCRLEIVGTGSEEAYLKEKSRQLGLDAVSKFRGYQSNPYPFIRHASCLLMPSAHEGLPYTLLEAMVLGTPIIATRVGGLAEILDHEKTALLVPHGDVGALAEAMTRLMSDTSLQKSLVANARARLHSQFTLEKMVDRYISVYRELVH